LTSKNDFCATAKGRGFDLPPIVLANVAYWHHSEAPARLAYVRYRGQIEKHLLILSLSASGRSRKYD
jgi:hypothetical protein